MLAAVIDHLGAQSVERVTLTNMTKAKHTKIDLPFPGLL